MKRRERIRREVILAFCIVLVAVAIVLLTQGIRHLASRPVDTSTGVAYIKSAETSDISIIEKKINRNDKLDENGQDTRSIKEKYSGAVIMGDSIAYSFQEYGVLNASSVVAKIGVHLTQTDEHIKKVKELNPQVIFLTYGMNDVKDTNGDIELFISRYKVLVDRLSEELPGAHIYVNSVFPAQKKAVDKYPNLGLWKEHNEALKAMCDRSRIGFIDTTGLVKEEYYEPDGIHFKYSFYQIWAEKMAEVADL